MAKHRDMLQFQAEHHPLEGTNRFETLEQYCLYLMHLRAYEEVRALACGKAVLDLGCNNGWGTHVVGQAARRVVGVDVSQSVLEEARRSATSANVEFRRVDGEELPFADDEFDIVASCQVIEHVADYGPYLGEILRVLSPDGIAVFSTPNAWIRLDPGMKPWFPFHVREFSGAELDELLRQWFPGVQVRGLFATKELYKVEYDRVQRSRERARRRAKALLPPYVEIKAKVIDSAKSILPDRMVRGVQGLVRRMRSGPAVVMARERLPQEAVVPQWVSRFSTDDLYYTEENIDEALDLLAVCGKTAEK
jgi:SAM-dependent methyltransferase